MFFFMKSVQIPDLCNPVRNEILLKSTVNEQNERPTDRPNEPKWTNRRRSRTNGKVCAHVVSFASAYHRCDCFSFSRLHSFVGHDNIRYRKSLTEEWQQKSTVNDCSNVRNTCRTWNFRFTHFANVKSTTCCFLRTFFFSISTCVHLATHFGWWSSILEK